LNINNSIILISIIFITFFIINLTSPFSIGLSLLIQIIFSCVFLNNFMKINWFTYIFYLIMIGGLLIIFLYFCSISSNEILDISPLKTIIYIFLFIIIISLSYKIWNPVNSNNYTQLIYYLNSEIKLNNSKIYDFLTINLILILIILLLLILPIISSITNLNNLPLRSSKLY